MKASALEFRFRVWIMVAILALGFWAPWTNGLHWGTRTTAWLWLGFELGGSGNATAGILAATWLAIAIAALAAFVRVWGTAYLGAGTVNNPEMKAGQVMADGPYRHVRNPLYLGTGLLVTAIAWLMPATGALLSLVLMAVFLLRLILGEEAFLAAQLGEPYLAYKRAVPRLLPGLRARVAAGGAKPRWGRALLSEINPIGILLSYAVLSWRYDSDLLLRAVLVCFGLSLLVRAALLSNAPAAPGS
jgi:protein-S-isoprenylcysteine O-methyltransferase Ste14